jgi:hypothetical protein
MSSKISLYPFPLKIFTVKDDIDLSGLAKWLEETHPLEGNNINAAGEDIEGNDASKISSNTFYHQRTLNQRKKRRT